MIMAVTVVLMGEGEVLEVTVVLFNVVATVVTLMVLQAPA